MSTATDLAQEPLRLETPADWVPAATEDRLALLEDHAHLERKAASNALDLLGRWPERIPLRGEGFEPADLWSRRLAGIARDEAQHLRLVVGCLEGAGGHLGRAHENSYAAGLHARVRRGQGRRELLDRLLVSALIEQRSCERFELLAAHGPDWCTKLYGPLIASERGHHAVFLELAASLPGPSTDLDATWEAWLDHEAELMQAQPPGCRIHAGWDA